MRLTPRMFWAMSLVEWRAALSRFRTRHGAALNHGDLESLMKEFPDGR